MTNRDIHLEIDFTLASEQDEDAVRETIDEAEKNFPKVVLSAEVRHGRRERAGALGLEWLPVLQILVSAPAILLLIREAQKILKDKLGTNSTITVTRKHPDGTEEKVTIKTTELDGAETLRALKIAKDG